jgi:hypothetical protein
MPASLNTQWRPVLAIAARGPCGLPLYAHPSAARGEILRDSMVGGRALPADASRPPLRTTTLGSRDSSHLVARRRIALAFACKLVAAQRKHGYDIGFRITVNQADGSTLPAILHTGATA